MTDETVHDLDGNSVFQPLAMTPTLPPMPTGLAAAVAAAPAHLEFKAPRHAGSIEFSTGRSFTVADGILTTPTDLSASEREALALNGFDPA